MVFRWFSGFHLRTQLWAIQNSIKSKCSCRQITYKQFVNEHYTFAMMACDATLILRKKSSRSRKACNCTRDSQSLCIKIHISMDSLIGCQAKQRSNVSSQLATSQTCPCLWIQKRRQTFCKLCQTFWQQSRWQLFIWSCNCHILLHWNNDACNFWVHEICIYLIIYIYMCLQINDMYMICICIYIYLFNGLSLHN